MIEASLALASYLCPIPPQPITLPRLQRRASQNAGSKYQICAKPSKFADMKKALRTPDRSFPEVQLDNPKP